MKKVIWCLCVFVAVALTTPNALAKKVLMIQGSQSNLRMRATAAIAVQNYTLAGYEIHEFKSWLYANPDSVLKSRLTQEGWDAIWSVSHAGCLPASGCYITLQTSQPNTDFLVDIDSLAAWFRQGTPHAPDEVILHGCDLGKDSTLAEKFRNPGLLKSYPNKITTRLTILWEFFCHWPSRLKGDVTLLPGSSESVFIALTDTTGCMGSECGDSSCVNFTAEAQAYVDSALDAMDVSISYLETDPAQARIELEHARQYFVVALDYESDDDNRSILQLHIDEINLILSQPIPALTPIGLVILVALMGYFLWRKMPRQRIA